MSQQIKEKILYHGTTSEVAAKLRQGEDLLGCVKPNHPEISGNLFDNPDRAADFADTKVAVLKRRGYSPGPPTVLEFLIPETELVDLGPYFGPNNKTHYYATTDTVPITKLPDDYLENLGLARETAAYAAENNEVQFYRVSAKYWRGEVTR